MKAFQSGNSSGPQKRSDRRDFIRKAAIAGGAAWTAPTLMSAVIAPAAAQTNLPVASGFYGSASPGCRNSTYRVNPATGAWTLIGPALAEGICVEDMAYSGGVIYGAADSHTLYSVNSTSGVWTPALSVSTTAVGITGAPAALYISPGSHLWKATLPSGASTLIGSLPGTYLVYDPTRNVIYAAGPVTLEPDQTALYRVDPETGFFGFPARLEGRVLGPMTFDPSSDTLYCASQTDGSLYSINVGTIDWDVLAPIGGAWNLIGPTGVGFPIGLVYVP